MIANLKGIPSLLSDVEKGHVTPKRAEDILREMIEHNTYAVYREGFADGYIEGKRDCKQTIFSYLEQKVDGVMLIQ